LEFLQAAGFERAALNNNVTAASKQGIVLCFITEHGVELLVELDFDARRQLFGQTLAQLVDLCCSGSRVGCFAVGSCKRYACLYRRSRRRWRHEVNAVGINFDDLRATFG